MTKKELKVILTNHKLWLEGKEGGVRANLGFTNLKGADLYRANLKGANLWCAYLKDANFYGAIMPEGFKGETE